MVLRLRVVAMLAMATLAAVIRTRGEIRKMEMRSDSRPIIAVDEFGFSHAGRLELNVTRISLVSVPPVQYDASKVGFFLCTRESWLHVLQQLEDEEEDGDGISCALDSKLVKRVYTFNQLPPNADSLASLYVETDPEQYSLVFANCYPHSLRVSMSLRSAMYNLEDEDGGRRRRDYLSAGLAVLPRLLFALSLAYLGLAALWAAVLFRNWRRRAGVFRIHAFMLALVLLKAANLVCEAEDKSYVRRTGSAHGWDVLFYALSFLKGITLFTLIVLIGTGWSFLKPYLQHREKRVLMAVIPLQVVANVAQVAIDESGPYAPDWLAWKQLFLLVDVLCCCAVLFPVVWSIKNLREAARTDGKAAVNLVKLTLFRRYYLVLVCYIYFTRVVVYALQTITSYRYLWTSVLAGELATLTFYVYTGYKFKPEAHNPYFAVVEDDEEEAALQQLKLEDEFEL